MEVFGSGPNLTVCFLRPDSSRAYHPQTLEEAIEVGLGTYQPYPNQRCHDCGRTKILLVSNGECYSCARELAEKEYNKAVVGGYSKGPDYFWKHTPCPRCGAAGKKKLDGSCYNCGAPGSRKEALSGGGKFFQPEKPCPGGHLGVRRVSDGACVICRQRMGRPIDGQTPRQKAIDAGEKWYPPDTPCKKCGKIADRHVDNGRCKGCSPVDDARAQQSAVRRQFPEMIISKEEAVAAGMNTYRTGEPCRRGHKSWRWVSNGGCLTCMGKD